MPTSPVTVQTNVVPTSPTMDGAGVPSPGSSVPTSTAPTTAKETEKEQKKEETKDEKATSAASSPAAPPTTAGASNTTTNKDTPTPKGRTVVPGFGLVMSLELFIKPGIVQPNVFPDIPFGIALPKELLMQDTYLMDLLTSDFPSQHQQLEAMQSLTVEY